jgi:FkbM family methyltransferase
MNKAFNGYANLQHLFASHPLTCDAPLRAWFRFAKWQLRSRLQEEILIDWIGGQKLAVRHGMSGATGNIYVGLHEFFDMMVPLHFLRRDDLFLDVGANVGTYTVLASGVCRAKTYTFEPDPETQRKLKRNIAINQLEEQVRMYDCALGAARGVAAFTIGLDTNNRLATANDVTTRNVRMETLDDTVSDSEPAMMKIDVEGAGLEVLCGAERVLAKPSLKLIELEYPSPECIRILSRHGFEFAWYDPFHRALSQDSAGRQSSNTLFVRDWSFVTDRLKTAPHVEVLGRKI